MNFDKKPNFQARSPYRQPARQEIGKQGAKQQPSVISRRLRAKLRAVSQPPFILSAVAFSLMGFFLWRTVFPSNQANLFEQAFDSSQGQLDPDSQAAGVDLDSLQVLLSDLNSGNNTTVLPPVNLLNPQQLAQNRNPRSQQPGSTVSILSSGTPTTTAQPTSNYPLLNYNPALSPGPMLGAPNQARSNTALIGFPNSSTFPGLTQQTMVGRQRTTPTSTSALQSAMNRYNAAQPQPNSIAPVAQPGLPTGQFFPPNYNQSYFGPPTTYFPPSNSSPATTPVPAGINYQSIPVGNTANPYGSPTIPSTLRRSNPAVPSLPTGMTTPNLMPPTVPIAPINSLRQSSSPAMTGQPGFSQGSPQTNSAPTQNAPVPVTPHSVPGTIGNGYINTFSNPASLPSN